MRLHRPLFSIVVILAQTLFSLEDYFEIRAWREANPSLDALLNMVIRYDTILLFVVLIGVCEMLTSPCALKKILRLVLVIILLGYNFSAYIPIDDFNSAVYNSAGFVAMLSYFLIVFTIGKYVQSVINRKLKPET